MGVDRAVVESSRSVLAGGDIRPDRDPAFSVGDDEGGTAGIKAATEASPA